eukprot:jgi/Galph1/1118/GphlegSOOS_G5791.1
MSKALLSLKTQVEKRKAQLEGKSKRWRRLGDELEDASALADSKSKVENEPQKVEVTETGQVKETKIEENAEDNVQKKENESSTKDSTDKQPPLSKAEIIKRLRESSEPATLFGESDYDRYIRLRDLELKDWEESKGQRNIFQQKLRQFKERDERENFYRVTEADLPSKGRAAQRAKEEMDVSEEGPENCSSTEEYCFRYMRRMLKMWKAEVEQLDDDTRRTAAGRKTLATFEQTKEYLKPLFKKLKKQQLDKGILKSLEKILKFVEQREYVMANDEYLRLAIGNAPWPVGATMVGIHARTAREKISEGKIAHVMNDEETRKYIQAVKRLITLSQKWYPTVPSKMVVG